MPYFNGMNGMMPPKGGKGGGYPPGPGGPPGSRDAWNSWMMPPPMPPMQQNMQRGYMQHVPQPQSRVNMMKSKYEQIISSPPPLPAFTAKPAPMKLREGREPSFTVEVKLPKGSLVSVRLAADDDVNDVKAAIEHTASVPGSELRIFFDGKELRDYFQKIAEIGIAEGSHLDTQAYNARSGWGVAALPPPPEEDLPPGYKKEELPEWKSLKPGQSTVLRGYDSKPMSEKGKRLMEIYESVMSRPPPGTAVDPMFWGAGGKNGPNSKYSHWGQRGRGAGFFQRPDPRSKVECTFQASGRCLRGSNCPFKHPSPSARNTAPRNTAAPAGFHGDMPPQ